MKTKTLHSEENVNIVAIGIAEKLYNTAIVNSLDFDKLNIVFIKALNRVLA